MVLEAGLLRMGTCEGKWAGFDKQSIAFVPARAPLQPLRPQGEARLLWSSRSKGETSCLGVPLELTCWIEGFQGIVLGSHWTLACLDCWSLKAPSLSSYCISYLQRDCHFLEFVSAHYQESCIKSLCCGATGRVHMSVCSKYHHGKMIWDLFLPGISATSAGAPFYP